MWVNRILVVTGILVMLIGGVMIFVGLRFIPQADAVLGTRLELTWLELTPVTAEIGKESTIPTPAGFEVLLPTDGFPAFVKLSGSKIMLTPKKGDEGEMVFSFVPIETNMQAKEIRILKVVVDYPEVDTDRLADDIETLLGEEKASYGVYLYDLKRDVELGVNHKTLLPPASISKVPVAVLVLQNVDAKKYGLSSQVPIMNFNKLYRHDRLSQYREGTMLSIGEYLRHSIVNSDNTAHRTLEFILSGSVRTNTDPVNKLIVEKLGVKYFFRQPHRARAYDVGAVFRGIYEGRYLSEAKNDLLLELLLNTAPHLQDGIPVGLPEGTKIAHKTGQLPPSVWEDAGIIYGKTTDYVLVVLNKDTTYKSARKKIQKISKAVYNALNVVD